MERDSFLGIECNKTYKTKFSLKEHYKYKHAARSTCKECSKIFGSKMLLGRHISDCHSPRLHSGDLCWKKLSRKRDLERHMVPFARVRGRKTSHKVFLVSCEMFHKSFATYWT